MKNSGEQCPPSARPDVSTPSPTGTETGGSRQREISVNFRQLLLSLYALLIVGLGVAGGVLFKDAHDEYSQLEQVESSDRRRLAEAQARLRDQERVLDRLRHDPSYVDKVIRIRLRYAKPDEFIFRFEDDDSKGSAGPSSVLRNDR
jgi:cell division protein FtsB